MKKQVGTARAEGGTLDGILSRPIDRRTLLKGALAATPLLLVGPSLLTPSKSRGAEHGFGDALTQATPS
jgi:hypothetical protein